MPRDWPHPLDPEPSPRARWWARVEQFVFVLVSLAGIIAWIAGCAPAGAARAAVEGCRVTDGDTVRCGAERIRLLGIDAPELRGHCRPGRRCAPGDGMASKASLAKAVAGRMRIVRVGTDRYGRTLAMMSGGRGDLSCWQLARGQAVYRADWDDGGRVASACRFMGKQLLGGRDSGG